MKRIFIGIFCLFVAIPCHAIEYSYGKASITDEYSLNSNVYQRGVNKGLTFFKDFDGTLDVKDCLGNGTATFTASRGASNPATYIDDNGIIQVTTTSNQPRFNRKIYTSSGLIDAKGLLIEAAGTNIVIRTDGTAYAGAADASLWTGWTTGGSTVTGTIKSNNVVCPELSSIVSAATQRVQYTGVAGDSPSKIIYITSTNTGAASFAQNDYATISMWVRSTSGNVGIFAVKLEIDARNNTGTLLNSYFGSDILPSVSSNWKRFTFTQQLTDAGTDRATARLVIFGIDNTDTVDIEIACPQLEKNPYATSWIPTTTAALTRNYERLRYNPIGNRSGGEESIFIKASPFWDATDSASGTRVLTAMDPKNRYIQGSLTSNNFAFSPNSTDSVGCSAQGTTAPVRGTSYTVAGVCKHSLPYASIYVNGALEGEDNDPDFTNINMPSQTLWMVGETGAFYFDGIIQKVAVFNHALSSTEVANVTDALD